MAYILENSNTIEQVEERINMEFGDFRDEEYASGIKAIIKRCEGIKFLDHFLDRLDLCDGSLPVNDIETIDLDRMLELNRMNNNNDEIKDILVRRYLYPEFVRNKNLCSECPILIEPLKNLVLQYMCEKLYKVDIIPR